MEPDNDLEPLREKNYAPEIAMQTQWVFRLNKEDTLLMLKALRGALKGKDAQEAVALCDRLTELRQKIGKDHQDALDRAWQHVVERQQQEKGGDKETTQRNPA